MINKDKLLGDLKILAQDLAWIEESVYDAACFETKDKLNELQFAITDLLYAAERMFLTVEEMKSAN
jgi:hypothetical protein